MQRLKIGLMKSERFGIFQPLRVDKVLSLFTPNCFSQSGDHIKTVRLSSISSVHAFKSFFVSDFVLNVLKNIFFCFSGANENDSNAAQEIEGNTLNTPPNEEKVTVTADVMIHTR